MEINGYDIDEVLFLAAANMQTGDIYSPRGQKTLELIQPTLIIENPIKCVVKNPGRNFSEKYLDHEMDWYLKGDLSIDEIGKHASMWERIADENGKVNSNYGHIALFQQMENYDGSQLDWVVDSLKKDKDSRQAIINFNQPEHKYDGNKDFVCTVNTQYLIRENKLIGITNMRSNDLIYGFCNDFPFFSFLQQKVHKELKETYPYLNIGKNIHTAASLHVYEKHFNMIEDIVKEYDDGELTLSGELKQNA